MKKKYIIIGIIVVIAVVLSIWLLNRPESLGNINHTARTKETNISTISFSGEKGDRIRFSFASTVKAGELDIILCDSKGNVVKKLDKAKRLKTFLDLHDSDNYILRAEYKDFIGSFQIKMYKLD